MDEGSDVKSFVVSSQYEQLENDDLYTKFKVSYAKLLAFNSKQIQQNNVNVFNNVCVEIATTVGVPRGAGGVHQGRAEKSEEGAVARPGGDQAHPECAASHRPVPRGHRSEQRHRGLHHRFQLLRAHLVDHRS